MALTDMIPWNRNRGLSNIRAGEDNDPFMALHRGMNRMLEDFTRGFGFPSPMTAGMFGGDGMVAGWPHVEVCDTDKEIKVVAELPGIEQNDVQMSWHDGILTIEGEKKSENNGPRYSERWHGKFRRALHLGPDIDPDNVNAAFKNGVLTVTFPKRPEAQSQVKRIPISNG